MTDKDKILKLEGENNELRQALKDLAAIAAVLSNQAHLNLLSQGKHTMDAALTGGGKKWGR